MNKPCPFCGGDGLMMTVLPAQFHGRTFVDVGPAQAWLMCECGYQSPFAASEERDGIESAAWTAHNAGPVHALAEERSRTRHIVARLVAASRGGAADALAESLEQWLAELEAMK